MVETERVVVNGDGLWRGALERALKGRSLEVSTD